VFELLFCESEDMWLSNLDITKPMIESAMLIGEFYSTSVIFRSAVDHFT
jgi:hypothetical protein